VSSFLVTGSEGQLGSCFQLVAKEFPQFKLFFTNRSELDIIKPEMLSNFFKKNPFEGIINCAAYTDVDKAEIELKKAEEINLQGVQNLIDFAAEKNIKIIHFSTDFVFDGYKKSLYKETDNTSPICFYGQSKLSGENALHNAKCLNTTLRISWLYSPFGNNFVKTMIRSSKTTKEINVIEDQLGKPTYGMDLVRAVLSNLDNPNFFKYKIYHFAQGPKTSWYEFACKIIEIIRADCKVNPIKSSDYPSLTNRPLNAVLDTKRIEKTLSLQIRDWEAALKDCINKIQYNEVI